MSMAQMTQLLAEERRNHREEKVQLLAEKEQLAAQLQIENDSRQRALLGQQVVGVGVGAGASSDHAESVEAVAEEEGEG